MPTSRVIDRGYAWVILTVSWLQVVIAGVLYYSTGVITTAVLEDMKEGVVKSSWVGSTLLGTVMLTGPITSSLVNLMGCRLSSIIGGLLILVGMVIASFADSINILIASYGVVVGLGVSFMETAAIVITGHYFNKYRPLASGIQTSGAGWGMLIGAPLVRFLLDTLGLSGMFLIMGGVGANSCVCGMLMRPSPFENRRSPTSDNVLEQEENTDRHPVCYFVSRLKEIMYEFRQVLSNVSFLLYAISFATWGLGESAFQIHLPNYAESKGTSPQRSAMLFTAMGISSMIARVLGGFAANDPAIDSLILHMGTVGVAGVTIMVFTLFSSSYLQQVIFSCLYGIYTGGPIALFNPITADLLGVKRLATGYGAKNLFVGISLLLGPPFAGMVLDISGSYDVSYLCSGAALILASLMTIPIAAFKKNSDNQHHTEAATEMTVKHVSTDGDKDETSDKLEPLITPRRDSVEEEQCVDRA
ncbi:monocarboxylate transporter 2-like isoform X1 [Haliotis asinina]|uniref:monocarboxylate transporter 2-like isoform X1 n=1 Tax=Haliotis asinina TaxID=109174 RepID=UPI0035325E56